MIAELGLGWLPFFLNGIDDRATPTAELFLGKWTLPLTPSEYIRRNVRATPLAGGSNSPLDLIMRQLPDGMLVFSSDFPHFEGTKDRKDVATPRVCLKRLNRAGFAGGRWM